MTFDLWRSIQRNAARLNVHFYGVGMNNVAINNLNLFVDRSAFHCNVALHRIRIYKELPYLKHHGKLSMAQQQVLTTTISLGKINLVYAWQ